VQVATLQANDRIKEKLQQTSGATASAEASAEAPAAWQGKPPAHSSRLLLLLLPLFHFSVIVCGPATHSGSCQKINKE